MSNEEIAPHVQELTRALGNRVEMEALEDELRRYMEYGISIPDAKRHILRNHGAATGPGVKKKLAELTTVDSNVSFVAKVITLNPKEITVQGEPREIYYGLLGDETKTVPFTAWKKLGIERGEVYEFTNAYVKEFRGEIDVNLGDRVDIKKTDVKLDVQPAPRRAAEKKIRDLRDGIGNVIVIARVLDVREKVIEVQGQKRTIVEGELADETGRIPFTSWETHESVRPDAVVRIENAYVKAFRGVPNLNFGESARIETRAPDELPPRSELETDRAVGLGELEEIGGGQGIMTEGVVLEVKAGSGLIFRCGQCNRVLEKRECRVHGRVDGIPDLRIKAVLDDGTGAATFFLNREATESLYGKDLEACQALAKEAMTTDVVLEEIADLLTARRLVVRGNATSDEFGLQIMGHAAEFARPTDVKGAAEKLVQRLERLVEVV